MVFGFFLHVFITVQPTIFQNPLLFSPTTLCDGEMDRYSTQMQVHKTVLISDLVTFGASLTELNALQSPVASAAFTADPIQCCVCLDERRARSGVQHA